MTVPARPKIYHIVHVDRLPSIIQSEGLLCDAEMVKHSGLGTTIGMSAIKSRRLNELNLDSRPGLYVGACVPFYFCPRSIMLYLIYQANLREIDWDAVVANKWSGHGLPHSGSQGKQAEFLVEASFPWGLVERVGILNQATYTLAARALATSSHKPKLEIKTAWYY